MKLCVHITFMDGDGAVREVTLEGGRVIPSGNQGPLYQKEMRLACDIGRAAMKFERDGSSNVELTE